MLYLCSDSFRIGTIDTRAGMLISQNPVNKIARTPHIKLKQKVSTTYIDPKASYRAPKSQIAYQPNPNRHYTTGAKNTVQEEDNDKESRKILKRTELDVLDSIPRTGDTIL